MTHIHAKPMILPQENIDTDQIIPARFLNVTDFKGLGQHAFADWRSQDGRPTDHPLNERDASERSILLAGHNFGCGSSREHAPQALLDFGFKAVISTRIADIFKNNALGCGLLAIEVSESQQQCLMQHPDDVITIDVESLTVDATGAAPFDFELEPFARHCFLSGTDKLGFLLSHDAAIAEFEQRRSVHAMGASS